MQTATIERRDIAEITRDGTLRLRLHEGQWRIWQSDRRFLLALAGTQGGKTSFGPHWFYREIQRCGPGDYMVVTPTYPLLEAKALPEFLRLFETWLGVGRFVRDGRKFVFSKDGARRTFGEQYNSDRDPETRVMFGYATDSESLEAATAKAAWLDEAGQNKFKLEAWEAILRRLSIYQGRVLLTTTPYNLGWIKRQLYDRWKAGDPSIEVSRFESLMNPAFPREEWDRAKETLPAWKFNMFYRAMFERPAGLIYDVFDEEAHTCPRFNIPSNWPRYIGLDFGGVNTAAMFYAHDVRANRLYAYREYHAGNRTAKEHARVILDGENGVPTVVGGSHSEGQWRREFRSAGLPVREPDVKSVEVGIQRVYGAHKSGRLIVFDDLAGYLNEKASYSRKLDGNQEPTEDIEDKNTFHFMDAERYIVGYLERPGRHQRREMKAVRYA